MTTVPGARLVDAEPGVEIMGVGKIRRLAEGVEDLRPVGRERSDGEVGRPIAGPHGGVEDENAAGRVGSAGVVGRGPAVVQRQRRGARAGVDRDRLARRQRELDRLAGMGGACHRGERADREGRTDLKPEPGRLIVGAREVGVVAGGVLHGRAGRQVHPDDGEVRGRIVSADHVVEHEGAVGRVRGGGVVGRGGVVVEDERGEAAAGIDGDGRAQRERHVNGLPGLRLAGLRTRDLAHRDGRVDGDAGGRVEQSGKVGADAVGAFHGGAGRAQSGDRQVARVIGAAGRIGERQSPARGIGGVCVVSRGRAVAQGEGR